MKTKLNEINHDRANNGNGAGIGYRRPPVHSRFKRGKSGNPKGRPKATASSASIAQKMLAEKVSLREGDSIRIVSKLEAVLHSLWRAAAKGDLKAIIALLSYIKDNNLFAVPECHRVEVVFVRAKDEDGNS
jgi:hypothetical protein